MTESTASLTAAQRARRNFRDAATYAELVTGLGIAVGLYAVYATSFSPRVAFAAAVAATIVLAASSIVTVVQARKAAQPVSRAVLIVNATAIAAAAVFSAVVLTTFGLTR